MTLRRQWQSRERRRGFPHSGAEPVSAGGEWRAGGYARFLKRQLSLPVSMMSQRCVRRSSMAVILASPNSCANRRRRDYRDQERRVFVELADQVEQQLATGLAERQVAEFVDDDEIVA